MNLDDMKPPTSFWGLLAQHGAWAFLVFALLGIIPGVTSSADRTAAEVRALDSKLAEHQREQLKVLRGICYRLKATSDPRSACE